MKSYLLQHLKKIKDIYVTSLVNKTVNFMKSIFASIIEIQEKIDNVKSSSIEEVIESI